MKVRKQLRQALVYALSDRVALAINIGNGIGLLLLVGLGYLYRLNLTGWILGWLLVSGLTNFLLAWNNERRLRAGRERIWNEIVGQPVTACTRFEPHADGWRGTVRLGSERWHATSREPLASGQGAVVAGRRGLMLEVAPRPAADPGAR